MPGPAASTAALVLLGQEGKLAFPMAILCAVPTACVLLREKHGGGGWKKMFLLFSLKKEKTTGISQTPLILLSLNVEKHHCAPRNAACLCKDHAACQCLNYFFGSRVLATVDSPLTLNNQRTP